MRTVLILLLCFLLAGCSLFHDDDTSPPVRDSYPGEFLSGDAQPIGFCYQESANVSTSCGGLSSGAYYSENGSRWNSGNITFLVDGNWLTGTLGAWLGPEASLYINYSTPNHTTNSSLWQLKYGDAAGAFPTVTENLTINTSCWNKNTIQFLIVSNNSCAQCEHINLYCNNGSEFILMKFINESDDSPYFFEEAMFWDTINYTSNATFCGSVNSVVFKTNLSRGNYSVTKNTYTEHDIVPVNQSTSGCAYVVDNTNVTYNQTYAITSTLNNSFIVLSANNEVINVSKNFTYNVTTDEIWRVNLSLNITNLPLNISNITFDVNISKV